MPFKKIHPLFIAFMLISSGCDYENDRDNLLTATLYYTPACATIKGYVKLEKNQKTFVFQHEIEDNFRKDSIEVNITFSMDKRNRVLTAECIQAPVIIIDFIKEN